MPSLAGLMALLPVHFASAGMAAMLRHAQACPLDLHFPAPCCWGACLITILLGVSIFVIQLEACNSQKK